MPFKTILKEKEANLEVLEDIPDRPQELVV